MRQLKPGAVPSPQAVAVLQRLEKVELRNALALFYLNIPTEAASNNTRRCNMLLASLPASEAI